jgi:NAD(P)H-dependent FMN reductase
VLKNTIDWLSRPPCDSALNGKVAAVMGASPGITGGARGQSQLRQAFVGKKVTSPYSSPSVSGSPSAPPMKTTVGTDLRA